mgnify:CR=1 FL=1
MKNKIIGLIAALALIVLPSFAAEKKQTTADHLQNVSVTIRSEGPYSNGEGSGVIFTRKDTEGNLVNFVWTAGHVIDNLRKTRSTVVDGRPKTIVEFKDPMVVKEIRQGGRTVGRLQMDAEVLKYSDATNGHDLALLRVRKFNFVTDTVTFYLEGFNLIVPVRRMQDYCEKHKMMWALDPKAKMPSEDELKKMPVEHEPKEKEEDTADEAEAKKMFPYRLRVTYPKVLIIKERSK